MSDIQISFKLDLRVQVISLLRIREVVHTGAQFASGYELKDVLVLPKSFTKGARATKTTRKSVRTSVRYMVAEFNRIIRLVEKAAKAGQPIKPEHYYPELIKRKCQRQHKSDPLWSQNSNIKLTHPCECNQSS